MIKVIVKVTMWEDEDVLRTHYSTREFVHIENASGYYKKLVAIMKMLILL